MAILKICGIRDDAAARAMMNAGASHAGFVFHPKSPRFIDSDKAAALAKTLRAHTPRLSIVALVADPTSDHLIEIMDTLAPDCVQFHGRETPASLARWRSALPSTVEIWKALGISTHDDLTAAAEFAEVADRILFDARPPKNAAYGGGHGQPFDWDILQTVTGAVPWILAGGLTADTIAGAVTKVCKLPGFSGVDVSSGVEGAPGQKDPAAIAAFIANARRAMDSA
jgi:phosphoribosylanthranilate isomerase